MHVRAAWPKDLEACAGLDHSYTTDRVWQMETRDETGVLTTSFRVARLPREIRVNYPRQGEELLKGWQKRDGFFVALGDGQIQGYLGLTANDEHGIAWVGDLVVNRQWRRQGVGTALLREAAKWGRSQGFGRLVIELQTKNYPAVCFCRARRLSFCGYSDNNWSSQDIGLFFGESLR